MKRPKRRREMAYKVKTFTFIITEGSAFIGIVAGLEDRPLFQGNYSFSVAVLVIFESVNVMWHEYDSSKIEGAGMGKF
jgi:hypothetical protein